MSEPRRNAKAKCTESIKRKAAEFVLQEKSKQRIKTSVLAERVGRKNSASFYSNLSQIQGADFSSIGLDYLFRLVEALDYEVDIVIKPRTGRVAA
jgi:hypothetical protein